MATQAQTQRKDETPVVIDVTESTFGKDVLVRSQEVPVVVDFWAPWCGPCRTLGPTLERLAQEANGTFILAKINVDENQRLAGSYGIQGIPAVKAFRDGHVVDEFSGALPESQVRAWLNKVVPAPADQLALEAEALARQNPQQAMARYRAALELDAHHPASLFGLGRLLLASGDASGADLLRQVPQGTPFASRSQALIGMADFMAAAGDSDPGVLAERVARDGSDLQARYHLAAHLARTEDYAGAMEQLLAVVMRDRTFGDDAGRRALLALFESLGDAHPLVAEYRRKLANALF